MMGMVGHQRRYTLPSEITFPSSDTIMCWEMADERTYAQEEEKEKTGNEKKGKLKVKHNGRCLEPDYSPRVKERGRRKVAIRNKSGAKVVRTSHKQLRTTWTERK